MPAPSSACVILVSAFSPPSGKCDEGLRELEKRGYTVRRGKGYSAIDQGRNQMTSEALHDGFAETMWIDSDIGFQADAVERLRSHDLPITCGLYPQPGSRTIACHLLPDTKTILFGERGGLMEVKYAAAGFLHVRREAYELIRERLALPLCNTRFGRGNWPFFMPGAFKDEVCGETGHRYLTEEFAFSHRARGGPEDHGRYDDSPVADRQPRLFVGRCRRRCAAVRHVPVSGGIVTPITTRAIPGGWSDREVIIGPYVFRLHTPADPDEVLGQIESPEAAIQPELADPYWAKLWPAAPLLAAAIVRNPPQQGRRMLELGCGSGLAGIAALASGPDVTFSDYVPFAVELAVHNAARNGFLDAKGMVLDWRQPREERFERIVAADVTYDRTNLAPLLDVVERMLAVGGEAWFGDAGRSPAEEFCVRASERGWSVTLFDEHDRAASGLMLGQYRRIVIRK